MQNFVLVFLIIFTSWLHNFWCEASKSDTVGAFCKAAPKLWNRLLRDIRHSKSIDSFKCSLKTYLFKTAFNLLFTHVIYFMCFR